ncbi:UDP-glucose dehydrogenase family protein [Candidatus Neomarinimicrobiota bacterium]
MKIAVVGTGYVGLVTGACFAHMGNQVQCVDIDAEKIGKLNNGVVPIYEPGLKEIIDENSSAGRLTFKTDLKDAVTTSEFIFLAVGTPMGEDGSADLQYILAAAREIGDCIDGYKVVITKSTVPMGTSELVRSNIQKQIDARNLEIKFDIASNPEFLKEGKAINDFLNPARIVIGADNDHVVERMRAMYSPFCRTDDSRILIMDIPSAELTKYAANAMLATRISFMNEIAKLCELTGANVDHVRNGIGTDDRIGRRFLFPGVGYGGSCFPKDVQALVRSAKSLNVDMQILSAVDKVNEKQKQIIVDKIDAYYGNGGITDKKFAVWGLSFKPETDDVRESPAEKIILGLLERGAKVNAYDPVAADSFREFYNLPIEYASGMYECLEGADALILVTEWHQFRRPDFDRMAKMLAKPIIFDGRNQYDPDAVRQRGFEYISIGRP